MERELDQCLSCVDCGVTKCNSKEGNYPDFCLTTSLGEGEMAALLTLYDEGDNRRVMEVAAMVEYEGYCQWTRVQEIIEFARRLGYRKLGIATCVGLIRESRTLARILRANGFEVYGVACKVGAVDKTEVGIDPVCRGVGASMCNPIAQAKLLNQAGTDLNLVVGLCVGHDGLFYKYSEALVTTVLTKDRVTGHNPAAVLYNADSYYRKKLFGDTEK